MPQQYTKTELRNQQVKLAQLQRYLPTLQLKKAMLQSEVTHAILELNTFAKTLKSEEERIEDFQLLLSESYGKLVFESVDHPQVTTSFENIAGVEIQVFEEIKYKDLMYSLFDTPPWLDSAIFALQSYVRIKEQLKLTRKKKEALEKELREVSIRVNLFEKVLIPRTLETIKKIKIFLGDQQLSAVCQAKVSKKKILMRKKNDH